VKIGWRQVVRHQKVELRWAPKSVCSPHHGACQWVAETYDIETRELGPRQSWKRSMQSCRKSNSV